MIKPIFEIIKSDKKTGARAGVLHTPHGKVLTPAYVIVATHGKIKLLKPTDIRKTKTQLTISNTYHLWDRAKNEKNFLPKTMGAKIVSMTDSGGFQVFSFGAAKEHGVGKVLKQPIRRQSLPSLVKISEKGVSFSVDNKKGFISPETSIKAQENIGADIIFAFDECTSPLHNRRYTKSSMERTHRWAKRCLKTHKRKDQLLYGIVQGGRFADLRQKSARTIGSMPFGGFGIGGSFGKDEMVHTLKTTVPFLPKEKPKHLLGIGRIEDMFLAVENGIDTFDCVIPTREARHARLYTAKGAYDIRKARYSKDNSRLAPLCGCPACAKNITRSKLHQLFKSHDQKAGYYATLHNVWFFNNLAEQIRKSIISGKFLSLKNKYLS